MSVSVDEPGEDSAGGRGISEEDSEDASDEEGAVGNTEGEDIQMSAAEAREARGEYREARVESRCSFTTNSSLVPCLDTYAGPSCSFCFHLFILTVCVLSGRARKKMDELERLLEIAKSNYTQLGGRLSEDRRRLREDRDSKRCVRILCSSMFLIVKSVVWQLVNGKKP